MISFACAIRVGIATLPPVQTCQSYADRVKPPSSALTTLNAARPFFAALPEPGRSLLLDDEVARIATEGHLDGQRGSEASRQPNSKIFIAHSEAGVQSHLTSGLGERPVLQPEAFQCVEGELPQLSGAEFAAQTRSLASGPTAPYKKGQRTYVTVIQEMPPNQTRPEVQEWNSSRTLANTPKTVQRIRLAFLFRECVRSFGQPCCLQRAQPIPWLGAMEIDRWRLSRC